MDGYAGSMNTLTFLSIFSLGAGAAMAQVPSIFHGADLKLGEKLIAENKCIACHQQKVGGDGSAIYKPTGRVNSPGFLRGMVCLLYTSPSPRDRTRYRMPSSA